MAVLTCYERICDVSRLLQVGTGINEHLYDANSPRLSRNEHRCSSAVCFLVNVCSVLNKELDDSVHALSCSVVEGRAPAWVLLIRRQAFTDHRLRFIEVALVAGVEEQEFLLVLREVDDVGLDGNDRGVRADHVRDTLLSTVAYGAEGCHLGPELDVLELLPRDPLLSALLPLLENGLEELRGRHLHRHVPDHLARDLGADLPVLDAERRELAHADVLELEESAEDDVLGVREFDPAQLADVLLELRTYRRH
mmetsp:Transcript_11488/g.28280  ORF Transcript_11488/g.28280 Transcript_11488/m.28280 type:complete len:252 (+) Transcript_11488:875-1630(+)